MHGCCVHITMSASVTIALSICIHRLICAVLNGGRYDRAICQGNEARDLVRQPTQRRSNTHIDDGTIEFVQRPHLHGAVDRDRDCLIRGVGAHSITSILRVRHGRTCVRTYEDARSRRSERARKFFAVIRIRLHLMTAPALGIRRTAVNCRLRPWQDLERICARESAQSPPARAVNGRSGPSFLVRWVLASVVLLLDWLD